MPLALALARLRGRVEWRHAGRRNAALARAAVALGENTQEREVRRLARQTLETAAVSTELTWRPSIARRMPVDGLEHLAAAQQGECGVILATVHSGPMLSLVHALSAQGHKIYISGGHRLHEPPPVGHYGRWVIAQNRWVEEAGSRWVHRGDSYPVLRELLRRGAICYLAFDIIGDVEVTLGGRRAGVSGGPAALARDSGARIVPGFVELEGGRQRARLLAPVEPAEHDDAAGLTRAVARALDPQLSAHREQLLAQHYAELWTGDTERWAATGGWQVSRSASSSARRGGADSDTQ
jgi:lauroyl/myristoyl acyltransferase